MPERAAELTVSEDQDVLATPRGVVPGEPEPTSDALRIEPNVGSAFS
jgi:hypothetical protein